MKQYSNRWHQIRVRVWVPSSVPLCMLSSLCTPRPSQGYPSASSPSDSSQPSSPSPGEHREYSHPPGFMQEGCHWGPPDTFLACSALWFLLPPSPQISSCVPQPAAYSEDLTGTSAVHSFDINPLCREEFCPSQVVNSNEFCHSGAIHKWHLCHQC